MLVEKVLGNSAPTDDLMTRLYYGSKRANGYGEEEIERKRLSLEGVLVPVAASWNEDLLAGRLRGGRVLLALPELRRVGRHEGTGAVNTTELKRWGRDLTPPLLYSSLRRLVREGWRRRAPEWEYVPEGWARARDDLRGWNETSVLEAYRSKLSAYRETLDGTGPLAFSSSAALDLGTPNVNDQNTTLVFAYVLLLSSHGRERVSVLDWGGGLGYYFYVARALLPDTVELDYHCKDMPVICEYGRQALPEITFWDNDGDCFARQYDFVFASSSLQYSEQWQMTLAGSHDRRRTRCS